MEIDNLIVGGGIVGLLLLRELNLKHPNETSVLFEKSPFLGDAATGRNSGVLHAGLYYPQDSLKLKHCLRGKKLWRELSKELGFQIEECGKFLISTRPEEDEALENLYQRSLQNEVEGIRRATEEEIQELSQWAYISQAFFSPSTGILSPGEVVRSLEDEAYQKGFMILKENEVFSIKREKEAFHIESQREVLKARRVFNAAGGFAPALREMIGLNDIQSYWVKGNYLKLKKDFYHKSLIYPVPLPALKGLGIHTSFDLDGKVRFGPNTQDVEDYEFTLHEKVKEEMFEGIQKVFKKITYDDLELDYCGIRSKIKKDGKLYTDFFINEDRNYFEFLGVESPGLTASPSIVTSVCSEL